MFDIAYQKAIYVLEVDFGSAQWLCSKLWEYINNPYSCSAFIRFRGSNAVFSIQRFNNKSGSFLEVTKLVQQGRKQNIVLNHKYRQLMLVSMALTSHTRTIEFSASHLLYAGSVFAGAESSPMRNPNLPRVQMTILTDCVHGR